MQICMKSINFQTNMYENSEIYINMYENCEIYLNMYENCERNICINPITKITQNGKKIKFTVCNKPALLRATTFIKQENAYISISI